MTRNWKAFLGIVLIYVFGCFSGAFSTSIYFHHLMIDFLQHPGVHLSEALERRLTGNLNLDENQKKEVHEYFAENLEQRKELQKQIQPQAQVLNRQTMQQIAAILHPDQVDLFHQNIEKIRKRLGGTAFSQKTADISAPKIEPEGPATNASVATPSPIH